MKSYLRREKTKGIKERLIAEKGTEFVYKHSHMNYRYIDKKYFGPIPTMIFGKMLGFVIWDPFSIVLIENKDLADAYKKHFELMWKIADKKP